MSSRDLLVRALKMLEQFNGPDPKALVDAARDDIRAALSEGKSATEGEVVRVVDEMVGLLVPDQGEMLTIEGRRLFGLASRAQTLLRAASPTGEALAARPDEAG